MLRLPAQGARLFKDLDYPTVKAWHRKESKAHPIGANGMITALSFPGLKANAPIIGLRKMWLQVPALDGCDLEDVTPQDSRRTIQITCTELGYPPTIADTLLGHSLGKIRDTCTRLSMDGILAKASEDTAQWIAAAMRGETPRPGAKVTADEEAKVRA